MPLFSFILPYVFPLEHTKVMLHQNFELPVTTTDYSTVWLILTHESGENRYFSLYHFPLDINAGKTKYLVMSRDQNAG
jgi:hypothetical protein